MATNKFYTALLIFLSTMLLNGCGLESNKQKRSVAEQTIYSEDGLFSVTIPAGWVQVNDYSLNDEADLQAQKYFGSQYFVALIEHKDDMEFAFDEWMEIVLDEYVSSFDDASVSDGEDIFIDGQPAKQYEIKGTNERIKVTLLATYINGEDHFAQILAWTLASKYKSAVDDLKAITNSISGL